MKNKEEEAICSDCGAKEDEHQREFNLDCKCGGVFKIHGKTTIPIILEDNDGNPIKPDTDITEQQELLYNAYDQAKRQFAQAVVAEHFLWDSVSEKDKKKLSDKTNEAESKFLDAYFAIENNEEE